EVGGGVVAHRVPVLPGPVVPERIRPGVEGDRVDVGEVPTLVRVTVEAVEQLHGLVDVVEDAGVAGDPVGLGGSGQGVDLLVHGDGVQVVAELGGEDLALGGAGDVDPVVPVHDALGLDRGSHVLPEVVGAVLGGLE